LVVVWLLEGAEENGFSKFIGKDNAYLAEL
jgi:hypothetical protein